VGPDDPLRDPLEATPNLTSEDNRDLPGFGPLFRWDRYWLAPLQTSSTAELVGVLGLKLEAEQFDFGAETVEALALVRERAAVALTDRALQREVFAAVDRLVPQVEAVQRMRAAARYGGVQALTMPEASLPADAWNWDDRRAGPSLGEGQGRVPGAVVGGLDQWGILKDDGPEAAQAQIQDALAQTGGRGVILGAGCVLPSGVSDATLVGVIKSLGGAPRLGFIRPQP